MRTIRPQQQTAREHHEQTDPHRRAEGLSDVILGGQDGLVNTLGVILGVAAASGETRIILAAGLAAAFAESVSMGAVAYTSTKASWEYYEAEREREHRHIHDVPEVERQEIRDIFSAKGFAGATLDSIVETITANRETWVSVMMAEEHELAPTHPKQALHAAFVVGFSAIVGSLLPLWPFFLLPVQTSIAVSISVSAAVLFGFGFYKSRVTVGRPWRGGTEMAVIGLTSAFIGYLVGWFFQAPAAP